MPDGLQVVSGGLASPVRVWDIVNGEQVRALTGDEGSWQSTSATPDGPRVVCGGFFGTIQVWDTETGATEWTRMGHEKSLVSVAVTPDGRRIVSGGTDGIIKVWDVPWLGDGAGRQRVSASIPSDQPLDREGIAGPDRLGYKPYAAALFQLLSNPRTELPLSLAVSAPWGSGKTSIMRWIGFELDYHRRNIYHQCTVLPGVGAWGVVGLPVRERIRAGVARAKRAPRPGKRRPGRPRTAKVDLAQAQELLATGANLSAVARKLGVSRGALRHRLATAAG